MWVKLAHEKRARGQIPAPDNPFPPSPACYVTVLTQKQRNSFFLLLFLPHTHSVDRLPSTSKNFARCGYVYIADVLATICG